jgi:hypothetical protein
MSWLLRTCSWVVLAAWFGSWALFAFVVAPTAFRVLPSHTVAGDLISPVLGWLHLYGIGAGVSLAAIGWVIHRGWLEIALALVLAAVCAASEFAVTPAIAAVGPQAFGAAVEPGAAGRFSDLHQTSRMLFGLVLLGVLALIGLHARTETADGRNADPSSP